MDLYPQSDNVWSVRTILRRLEQSIDPGDGVVLNALYANQGVPGLAALHLIGQHFAGTKVDGRPSSP